MVRSLLDTLYGKSDDTRATGQPTVAWPENTCLTLLLSAEGNTYLRLILWPCFGLQTGTSMQTICGSDLAASQQVGHFEGLPTHIFQRILSASQS